MQEDLNDLLRKVRINFWRKSLDLGEVKNRLTNKKRDEFEEQLKKNYNMDFTEKNIRAFVLNLIGGYEKTLTEAVLEIFELFSRKHSWEDEHSENIHYFNGWKTNDSFKVNKKVIIPLYGGYRKGPFIDDWSGKWKLQYGCEGVLQDIDTVMAYFDGMQRYYSIKQALENAFVRGESRKIKSSYFTLTAYKKGTLHLVFNSEDILRRFNVVACRGREWLPQDYGTKAYKDMTSEERSVVDSFEGQESYTKNLNAPLLGKLNIPMFGDMTKAA